MGILKPSIGKRFFFQRLSFSQGSRNQSNDRIDENHGGWLSARQYVISDGDLPRVQTLGNAIVEPLIMSAEQSQPGDIRKFINQFLTEWFTLRRKNDFFARAGTFRLEALQRRENRAAHQDHARPTAERAIIDRSVSIGSKIPKISARKLNDTRIRGPAHDAVGKEGPEDFGEES